MQKAVDQRYRGEKGKARRKKSGRRGKRI